jgi:hypothetical protein
MMNCAEEAAAANAIGAPCADAYTVWFACVLTQFETSAAETCAMAVAWYETHELPPEDALCYAELSAFAAACELG